MTKARQWAETQRSKFKFVSESGELRAELTYDGDRPKSKAQALELSIVKWELMIDRPTDDCGASETCGLCLKYNDPYTDTAASCDGCPVKDKTGERFCHGSPFDDWSRDRTRENARRELRFLVSLRRRKP